MITPAQIEHIAKLLAGDNPGWQSRFAAMLGTSRGYVSNLVSGERGITQTAVVRIIVAARREMEALRARADEVDVALSKFPTMGELAKLPHSDAQDKGNDK